MCTSIPKKALYIPFHTDIHDDSSNQSEEVVSKEAKMSKDSSDEYETITELLQINPYVYKPVTRVVRRPHLNTQSNYSSHTITSASARGKYNSYTGSPIDPSKKWLTINMVKGDTLLPLIFGPL